MLKLLGTLAFSVVLASAFVSVVPVLGAPKTAVTKQTRANTVKPGGTVAPLTIGECAGLGCVMVDDSSCPGIWTNYNGTMQTKHWRCKCNSNSAGMCVDKAQ
jgi:hypothetical protein